MNEYLQALGSDPMNVQMIIVSIAVALQGIALLLHIRKSYTDAHGSTRKGF